MWSRVIEFMLGCWLAISPFIFTAGEQVPALTAVTWASALLVICLSLVSYWPPLRHAHLAIFFLALALIGYGRFAVPAPIPPALQNLIMTGLLLLMFALVPNRASQPPRCWYDKAPGMS
ncbi:MAG: hypothetical protein ACIAZJ_24990 [Gimesia chilikensis]|uniref:hypothetical protein n=1 Tax=Gimesia chilikensis TaxID=2605989 RepID=UPI00378CEA75